MINMDPIRKYIDIISEANKKRKDVAPAYTGPKVIFEKIPLFDETVSDKKMLPGVQKTLTEFLTFKNETPLARFGRKDTGFVNKRVWGDTKHAGITDDISIFYKISGSNPIVIVLYGLFDHREAGIGTPPNQYKQQTLVKKFKFNKTDRL